MGWVASHPGNSSLPDPQQKQLIQTCLTPAAAIAPWRAAGHDPAWMDEACQQLLPHAYCALRDAGYTGEDMLYLQAQYEQSQQRRQQLMQSLAQVLDVYAGANIPVILLKGIALAAQYYPDPAMRTMRDIDILVPFAQAAQAMALLERAGWTPRFPVHSWSVVAYPSLLFYGPDGVKLDLHWHVHDGTPASGDAGIWQRAEPTDVQGQKAPNMSAADHLLHACIHGYYRTHFQPLHWLVDAFMIQRHAGSIAWDVVVQEAQQRCYTLRLHGALALLSQEYGLPVPGAVMRELKATRAAPWEHAEYRYVGLEKPYRRTLGSRRLHKLRSAWFRHRRRQSDAGLLCCVVRFPKYLRQRMLLASVWHLPWALVCGVVSETGPILGA